MQQEDAGKQTMIQRSRPRKGPCFFVTYSRTTCQTRYRKTLGNDKRFEVLLLSGSLQQAPLDSWGGKRPLGDSAPTSCSVKVRATLSTKILLLPQVLAPVLGCHSVSPWLSRWPLLESLQGVYAFLVLESHKLVPVSSCSITSAKQSAKQMGTSLPILDFTSQPAFLHFLTPHEHVLNWKLPGRTGWQQLSKG